MECSGARDWLFRLMDDELNASQRQELDAHLAACEECSHQYRLLTVPKRIGRLIPDAAPSPYFYTRLRARIDAERRSTSIWQIVVGLSHKMIPALALLTLALLAAFAYEQMHGSSVDVYQAYDTIFMSAEHPQRMVIADQGDITDDSVVYSIAEKESEPQGRQPSK